MQQNTHLHTSPTVRIHKSSPTPAQTTPMLAQSQQFVGGGWNDFQNAAYLSAFPRNFQQDPRYHKRASSGSSVTSAGPPSPLDQQANLYHPRIATSDANFSPSRYDFDFTSPQTAKTTHSVPDAVMFGANHNYGAVDMRRVQSQGHDDRASYMGAPSVSTMSHHNSPATPQTFDADYSDEKAFGEQQQHNFNMMMHGLQGADNFNSMAYHQSLQDVFPNQQMYAMQKMNNHRQSMMQDRIQAAQQSHLRTNSPTSNPRDRSPFRQSSPYNRPVQPQRQQQVPQLQKQRTSISPKELMLDERDIDDNQPSLFPEQTNFQQRRQPSNLSNFYTASAYSQEPAAPIPQQYPFVSQSSRADSMNVMADATPDFTAPMLSMESTNEEEPSSQQSIISRQTSRVEPQNSSSRPADTSSDAGTYSCTYHGCPQRFDSPAKLQKHKREGHRQHDHHAAISALALRNSQAGPHRCDRINPATGKPCNSVFSRPYDLTRHEDTIHNGRKQKVRCHLCTEEKTFSRNDALTRHMRVVHPDVDWVGKQKRKSHK